MSRRKQGGGKRRAARGDEEAMRTCIACRAVSPRDAALRFVRAPDGAVLLDVRSKLPGRGAHTCPRAACVQLLDPPLWGEQVAVRVRFQERLEDILGLGAEEDDAKTHACALAFFLRKPS